MFVEYLRSIVNSDKVPKNVFDHFSAGKMKGKSQSRSGMKTVDSLRKSPGERASGLGEEKMDISGVTFLETRFAVAKIVFPSPAEGIVVPKGGDFLFVLLEEDSPFAQGARIVVAEIVKGGRAQIGSLHGCRDHGGGRRNATTGENPGSDVVDLLEVLPVPVVGHGDPVNQGSAIGGE